MNIKFSFHYHNIFWTSKMYDFLKQLSLKYVDFGAPSKSN